MNGYCLHHVTAARGLEAAGRRTLEGRQDPLIKTNRRDKKALQNREVDGFLHGIHCSKIGVRGAGFRVQNVWFN